MSGDPVDDRRPIAPYLAALESLHRRGARATVAAPMAVEPVISSETTGR